MSTDITNRGKPGTGDCERLNGLKREESPKREKGKKEERRERERGAQLAAEEAAEAINKWLDRLTQAAR